MRYEFFSFLYPPKTLNTISPKVHFSKFALYMLVFHILSNNMLCILLERVAMDVHHPFFGKLKIHFSNIGNPFLKRITFIKFTQINL